MKPLIFILFALLIGCQSKLEKTTIDIENSNDTLKEIGFEYYNVEDPFDLIVTEFYPTNHSCGDFAIPYALIIGETVKPHLPDKVSVISKCDYRNFEIGQKLRIVPEDEPDMSQENNGLD